MSDDPYMILGVKRDAGADDIRKAYRKLAKAYHPDLNPGDKKAEDRFKRASVAYDLLSDPEKRARFDRGEIDAGGAERPQRQQSSRAYAEADQPFAGRGGFSDFVDLGDVFSDLFGSRPGGGHDFKMRGGDVRYELTVEFLEAANGTVKRVGTADGRTLDIAVPAGLADGQTLRLKGQGSPGVGGGTAGDAFVLVHVRPHPLFERKGSDIHMDLPISLPEAVLGARIKVPTVTGPVTMIIPKESNTGAVLRLREKGISDAKGGKRGDQYVRLKIMLPDSVDSELRTFVEQWSARHPYDPRRGT